MDRTKLIKILAGLIFLIFSLNFLANKFYWYSSIWYFDMIMHFLGGFWLGLVYLWVFQVNPKLSKAMLFVLVVGLGWEAFEFLFNNHIAQNYFDIVDSLSDIFFDLFGGLCAILCVWKKQLR